MRVDPVHEFAADELGGAHLLLLSHQDPLCLEIGEVLAHPGVPIGGVLAVLGQHVLQHLAPCLPGEFLRVLRCQVPTLLLDLLFIRIHKLALEFFKRTEVLVELCQTM